MHSRPISRRGGDIPVGSDRPSSDVAARMQSDLLNSNNIKYEIQVFKEFIENLERRAHKQHNKLLQSMSDLERSLSGRSALVSKMAALNEEKLSLRGELSNLEFDITSSQAKLDAVARRNSAPQLPQDLVFAITQLEDRIKSTRARLSRGLAELLILTDGEFIYMQHFCVYYCSSQTATEYTSHYFILS